jgi:hypothetical protein
MKAYLGMEVYPDYILIPHLKMVSFTPRTLSVKGTGLRTHWIGRTVGLGAGFEAVE